MMKKLLTFVLITILVSVLLLTLTSCSKKTAQKKLTSTTKNESKKDIVTAAKKACDVFSVNEASKAMGTKLVAGSNEKNYYDNVPGAESSYCGFTNNGKTPDTLQAMTVALYEFPDADLAQQSLTAAKKQLKEIGNDVQTVNGLGDGAYFSDTILYVLSEKTQLAVTVVQPGKGGLDKAKAAAKVILPRL